MSAYSFVFRDFFFRATESSEVGLLVLCLRSHLGMLTKKFVLEAVEVAQAKWDMQVDVRGRVQGEPTRRGGEAMSKDKRVRVIVSVDQSLSYQYSAHLGALSFA